MSIVETIVALSGSPAELRTLRKRLKEADGELTVLLPNIDDVVASLDMTHHALGVLFLLLKKSQAVEDGQMPVDLFMDQCAQFFQACNPRQVQLAGHQFLNLVKAYAKVCQRANCVRASILPLLEAVRKSQKTPEYLTGAHALFMRACVLCRMSRFAVRTVGKETVFEVDRASSGVEPEDALLYFYYLGLAFLNVRAYDEAMESFLLLFTVPAEAMSKIMVEGYKKFVLASLLATGKVAELPKFAPADMGRYSQVLCDAYTKIATSFETGSRIDLESCLFANEDVLRRDGNFGLATLCLDKLDRINIHKLTQTYLTVSLETIVERVGLAGTDVAERIVLEMIEQGTIHATINQKAGMVEFIDDPESYQSAATAHLLDATIAECVDLSARVNTIDDLLAVSKDYLLKTEFDTAANDAGNMLGEGGEGFGFDDFGGGVVGIKRDR